jgi:DNA polymerase V
MKIFALVDCNNFYASCERIFAPRLEQQPIVILSSNDGCVIARSNEAKTLGIPMGAPYFQWKDFCVKNRVNVFSSNFCLYGELSSRIMVTLQQFCPELEVYSIDEAFMDLSSYTHFNLTDYALQIRHKVKQWVGIPVSIGIAPTKVLAKIANYYAKKHTLSGVFDLCDEGVREKVLAEFPIADIWGIGRKFSAKLKNRGIHFARDLRDADLKTLRRCGSVVLERIVTELRGISCLSLEEVKAKKQIMCSRSFGRVVTQLYELEEAISTYAARTCVKLREQKSVTRGIYIFAQTSRFNQNETHYANSATLPLVEATADTRVIIQHAKMCLRQIFRPGYRYNKVGIMLLNLSPATTFQHSLLAAPLQKHSEAVMQIVDKINNKIGKNGIFICAEGTEKNWRNIKQKSSPAYLTNWGDLVRVVCK